MPICTLWDAHRSIDVEIIRFSVRSRSAFVSLKYKDRFYPAPQLLKGSKTRTETSAIRSMRESERLKSVFLDAITHDFKTPLTSIKVSVTLFAWRPRN